MIFRRKPREQQEAPVTEAPTIAIDPLLGDPKAKALSAALGQRDWPTSKSIILSAEDPAEYGWLVEIASTKANVMEFIDDFIRADPDSILPLLIKGVAAIDWAWEARGSGWARDVKADAWQVFRDRLRLAEDCLDDVIERDPRCMPAHGNLISLAMARSKPMEERRRRFQAAVAIDPLNVAAHVRMLHAVTKKWGGSTEEMFAFARERVALAPDGHDLHALIVDAHIEEWLIRDRDNGNAKYLEQREVGDEILAAAHRSIFHPAYRRSSTTPGALNTFAFGLTGADRFAEAHRCYLEIGDTLVTRGPWSYRNGNVAKAFLQWRDYIEDAVEKLNGGTADSH